jgi:hypothetical protein
MHTQIGESSNDESDFGEILVTQQKSLRNEKSSETNAFRRRARTLKIDAEQAGKRKCGRKNVSVKADHILNKTRSQAILSRTSGKKQR